jgi:hypothetical protein
MNRAERKIVTNEHRSRFARGSRQTRQQGSYRCLGGHCPRESDQFVLSDRTRKHRCDLQYLDRLAPIGSAGNGLADALDHAGPKLSDRAQDIHHGPADQRGFRDGRRQHRSSHSRRSAHHPGHFRDVQHVRGQGCASVQVFPRLRHFRDRGDVHSSHDHHSGAKLGGADVAL